MRSTRRGRIVLVASAALLCALPAAAYRPFDSTDADVAGEGELEIELGPVGYVNDGGAQYLATPDWVANYGAYPGLEVVLEGRGLAGLEHDEPDYQLVDLALRGKTLLRSGSLQGETGPSVALELGLLVPTRPEEPAVGGEARGIVSQRFSYVTAHLNGNVAYTRASTWELGLGLILEGPAWRGVRPVAEATYARELGEATHAGGLVGLIWQARDDLSFDLGFRYARDAGEDAREVRVGLTWSLQLGRK